MNDALVMRMLSVNCNFECSQSKMVFERRSPSPSLQQKAYLLLSSLLCLEVLCFEYPRTSNPTISKGALSTYWLVPAGSETPIHSLSLLDARNPASKPC